MLFLAARPRGLPRSWRRPTLPSPRRFVATVLVLLLLAAISTLGSTLAYLRVPAPTGDLAVGRTDGLLVDSRRVEVSSRGGGPRAVRIVAWYPAEAGTGTAAEYVPGYDRIREGLATSGELPGPAVAGLSLVQGSSLTGAAMAGRASTYPVVLLSPGNATNVAFYAALAEDLASRGYVVVGVDHPFQVAAADIGRSIAIYEGDAPIGDGGAAVAARIDERVADLTFVIDRLQADGAGLDILRGRVDVKRIAVAGHSNGGLAAAGVCADGRVVACVNIDGQHAGGPFGVSADPTPPSKPFLVLTKETSLHPALVRVFEAAGAHTYRVVLPAATHGSFTDGSRYEPRLLPVDTTPDHVLTVERAFVATFLDAYVRGSGAADFRGLPAPTDVYVEVYPLRGKPTLPHRP